MNTEYDMFVRFMLAEGHKMPYILDQWERMERGETGIDCSGNALAFYWGMKGYKIN